MSYEVSLLLYKTLLLFILKNSLDDSGISVALALKLNMMKQTH